METDSRIVRHSSEFGEWDSVERRPDRRLAPYVTLLAGWLERTTFSRRREVPHAGCVLIINIENRLGVSDPARPERMGRYHAFFAGLCSGYVVTESSGRAGGIQMNLTPIGAQLIAGMPAHELANRVIHLEDVFGPGAVELTNRIETAPDWETRFDLVEAHIFKRLASARRVDEGVAWAYSQLGQSNGLVSIGALSSALGWQHRRLIERFRQDVGLPPKQVARIMRFSRAAEMLDSQENPCLADIAAVCGYFDQAHFSREFREFAGSTPSQFLGRLIPNGGLLDEVPGNGVNAPTPA